MLEEKDVVVLGEEDEDVEEDRFRRGTSGEEGRGDDGVGGIVA